MSKIKKTDISELIEQARIEAWEELDLSGMNLQKIPNEIFGLRNLKSLDIADNNISEIPFTIGLLKKLKTLNLNNNKIHHVAHNIGYLSNLSSLSLANNNLHDLPNRITNLKKLKQLDISANYFKKLPKSISSLSNLTSLDISRTHISNIPSWIGSLFKLSILDFSGIKEISLPRTFSNLKGLNSLSLADCSLTSLPNVFNDFPYLHELNLAQNNLASIPKNILSCNKLVLLDLSYNKICHIPQDIEELSKLSILILDNNNISKLPTTISKLSKLAGLSISNNKLSEIPPTIAEMNLPDGIYLHGNMLEIPPEIIKTNDAKTIFNFISSTNQAPYPLNQAKMLLVGQGGVGKTSLVKRLLYNKFNAKEKMTEGISITDWTISIEDSDITAKIWDFGGQEVMHATHQFFLTERSLYLLVWDARQEDTYGQVEYWLKTIQSFGGNSPILIVSNKIDDGGAKRLDENALQRKYPNIIGFHNISCKKGLGLEDLKNGISEAYANMPHIRDTWPVAWFNAKEAIEAKTNDHITLSDYESICHSNTVAEADYTTLINFLHDLGVVLCFYDDPRLCDTAVLNPEWVTGGVYKILNSEVAKDFEGKLSIRAIKEILNYGIGYRGKEMFIIDMMRKFELCFATDEKDSYLIPELLASNEPKLGWNEAECLALEYHYNILPQSIISRFIVRMHNNIYTKTYWKNGVMLINNEGTNKALVRADSTDKTLSIFIDGPVENRRDFIVQIRGNIDYIHNSFKELKTEAQVPIPNNPGVYVPYRHLRMLESNGEKSFYPQGMSEKVEVKSLLDGVKPDVEKYTAEFIRLLQELKADYPELAESIPTISNDKELERLTPEGLVQSENRSMFTRCKKLIQYFPKGVELADKTVKNVQRVQELADLIPNLF